MAAKAKARVFLDSNVILSGLYTPGGAPGSILEQHISGRIEVVVSRQVLEEVVRAIREKLPEALPALREFLLNSPPSVVEDASPRGASRWSDVIAGADAAILAAAVSAQRDYFVTGDKHFLRIKDLRKKTGLRIVSPAEFIEELK